MALEEGRLTASELQVGVDMGLLNVGKVGLDTAWNFALGLPKHDLGWPSLRPLFRDSMFAVFKIVLNGRYKIKYTCCIES